MDEDHRLDPQRSPESATKAQKNTQTQQKEDKQ